MEELQKLHLWEQGVVAVSEPGLLIAKLRERQTRQRQRPHLHGQPVAAGRVKVLRVVCVFRDTRQQQDSCPVLESGIGDQVVEQVGPNVDP